MKKPALFFAACDINNFPYAVMFWNSMVKYHDPKDIDMVFYTNEKRKEMLDKLPKGIKIEDITPFLEDQMFWYRQKPILAEPFMDDYELVVGFDVDQIVCADLNYILETKDYDIAVVVNWNRYDPQFFGYVDIMRLGITPAEYYNCGLVALRSKKFVHHWKVECFTENFNRSQYKEQDIMNVLVTFGNYNVRNLDAGDGLAKMNGWWGIISKGEWNRTILKDNKLIVPKGLGDTPFPPTDIELKVLHFGGGAGNPEKMNYRTKFSEDIIARLDYLVSDKK